MNITPIEIISGVIGLLGGGTLLVNKFYASKREVLDLEEKMIDEIKENSHAEELEGCKKDKLRQEKDMGRAFGRIESLEKMVNDTNLVLQKFIVEVTEEHKFLTSQIDICKCENAKAIQLYAKEASKANGLIQIMGKNIARIKGHLGISDKED